MLIDCDSCTAGPSACGDCIVTYLLSAAPAATSTDHDRAPDLTESEIAAVGVLAAGGLVPPLRLVTGSTPSSTTRQVRREGHHRGLGAGSQAG